MRLIFAVLACGLLAYAAEEVELITEPRPGEEYVLFKGASVQQGRAIEPEVHTEVSVVTSKNVHIPGVTVKPFAAVGVHQRQADAQELRAMARKIEKEQKPLSTAASHNIEVKSEAESGLVKTPVTKHDSEEISVPVGKFQRSTETSTIRADELPPLLNVLTTGPRKPQEDGIHGKGVISDAPLYSSGSQPQATRINVKKGPNGQEYEYEYLYYYDDEADDATNGTSPDVVDEDVVVSSSTTTTTTTTEASTTTLTPSTTTQSAKHEEEVDEEEEEEVHTSSRSRVRGGGWSNARNHEDRSRGHEESSSRGGSAGRVRYTTIERARQNAAEEESHTERPAVNEVVPVRGGSRFHSRTSSTEAPEERLPASTRFPPRNQRVESSDTPSRAAVRPSLELVDSSSFRTGTPSLEAPSFPQVPNGPVKFLGVTPEESVSTSAPSRRRGRPTTTVAPSSTTEEIEEEISTEEVPLSPNSLAVEKAAYDLYAILQQAQDKIEDNVVVQDDDAEVVETTTVVETTLPPTTTPTTTSTTTTTTTTTTTEAPTTTPAATGRGRYRSRPGGNHATPTRTRSKSAESTPAPQQQEASTTRTRQRFGTARKTATTAAPAREEESNENVVSPRPRNRFRGTSSRNVNSAPAVQQLSSAAPVTVNHVRPSFPRRRGPSSTTASPVQADSGEETSTVAATPSSKAPAAPARPNIRARPAIQRPLRTGGRLGLPSRLGASTTAAPVQPSTAAEENNSQETTSDVAAPASEEASAPDSHEQTQDEEAAVTTPLPGALTRLKNRPRLRITERPAKSHTPAPASGPNNRRHLVSSLLPRRRPTPAAAEQEAVSESSEQESHEEAAETAEVEQQAPTAAPSAAPEQENRLSSLLKKRERKSGLFPARHTTAAPVDA